MKHLLANSEWLPLVNVFYMALGIFWPTGSWAVRLKFLEETDLTFFFVVVVF